MSGDGTASVEGVGEGAAVEALRRAAKRSRVAFPLVLMVLGVLWSVAMSATTSASAWQTVLSVAVFAVVFGPAWWFLAMPVWVRRPPESLVRGVVVSEKLGELHVRCTDDVVVIARSGVTSRLTKGDGVWLSQPHRRSAAVVVLGPEGTPTVVAATPRRL